MSTNTTPGNQTPGTDEMYTTDELRRIARSRPQPLGVDARGRTHYHSTRLGPVGVSVVWVMRDDDIVHDRVLIEGTDDDLSTWVAFVASECGWDECHYDDRDWGAWLSDQLGGGDGA